MLSAESDPCAHAAIAIETRSAGQIGIARYFAPPNPTPHEVSTWNGLHAVSQSCRQERSAKRPGEPVLFRIIGSMMPIFRHPSPSAKYHPTGVDLYVTLGAPA